MSKKKRDPLRFLKDIFDEILNVNNNDKIMG